ncbi:hypothetical protein ACWGRK_02050 [Saccharomonospora azurea]
MPTWDQPVQTGAVGASVGGGAAAAMGASLNSKAVDSMASEAKEMLKSAKSGGFRVSEDAAEPIRKVLKQFATEVEEMSRDLVLLTQVQPALGAHEYGKKVAEFQRRATTVDPTSPARVLGALHKVLLDADQALDIAVKKYRESEESAASSINSKQV